MLTFNETPLEPTGTPTSRQLFLRIDFPAERPAGYHCTASRCYALQERGEIGIQCLSDKLLFAEVWSSRAEVVEALKAFALGADAQLCGLSNATCPHINDESEDHLWRAWHAGHSAARRDGSAVRPAAEPMLVALSVGEASVTVTLDEEDTAVITALTGEELSDDLVARWCSDMLTFDLDWQHDNVAPEPEPEEHEYASFSPRTVKLTVGEVEKLVKVTALEVFLISNEKGSPESDGLLTRWAEEHFRHELRMGREELNEEEGAPAAAA